MSEINVTISGLRPILFHNPISMIQPRETKRAKAQKTPQEEAEMGCYWNDDKSSLTIPSRNLHRAVITASRAYRDRRRSVTPFVSGSLEIRPEMIPFGTKDYDIYTCRVLIQKAGVMRSRPMLRTWKISFTLLVDDRDMPPAVLGSLREIFEEAGRRVGIGDYRVEKGGPYGKFEVVKWEAQE